MQKPKIERQADAADRLRLRRKVDLCRGLLDDPVYGRGVLLKVMTRGHSRKASSAGSSIAMDRKIGATVENVLNQTIDSEVTLSTVLPA